MTSRLYSQQHPSQKMAENKLFDICVRGRLGIWLGFAILVIIVMATSLSKDGQTGNSDEQTGNSDKQTAGIGIQTGNKLTTTPKTTPETTPKTTPETTPETTTTKTTTTTTFTTFKSVWSVEGLPNSQFAFEDLPQEVSEVDWDEVYDGCTDNADR